MVHLGAVSRADADRVISERRLPARSLAAAHLPGCGTVPIVLMSRWMRQSGFRVSFTPPPGQFHVDSARFPVRFFYDSVGQEAKARDALSYAEDAWQVQVVDRGYRPPWTAGDPAPVSLGMDYYFAVTDGTWSGLTIPLADIPSTPICDCSTRILIDETLGGANLGSTIEHEFNHTTQAATDCVESISAWESFATAVDFIAFPGGTREFIQEFQDWPEFPLDYWTSIYDSTTTDAPYGAYQYGASLFPLFLVDRFGDHDPKILKDTWEAFKEDGTYPSCPNDPDWFQGLDALLATKGSSLVKGFTEFAEWRAVVGQQWDDGAHFANGTTFPQPKLTSLTTLPSSGDLDAREYGSRYLEFVPTAHDSVGPLTVTVKASTAATWSGSVLVWRSGQPVQSIPIAFDAQESGTAQTGLLDGVQRVVIVVSQLQDGSHRTDDGDYDNARSFHYQIDQGVGLDAGPMMPDAARPRPDASHAGLDAAQTGGDAGLEPAKQHGCGCGLAGAPAGALALLSALGLALRRRAS